MAAGEDGRGRGGAVGRGVGRGTGRICAARAAQGCNDADARGSTTAATAAAAAEATATRNPDPVSSLRFEEVKTLLLIPSFRVSLVLRASRAFLL